MSKTLTERSQRAYKRLTGSMFYEPAAGASCLINFPNGSVVSSLHETNSSQSIRRLDQTQMVSYFRKLRDKYKQAIHQFRRNSSTQLLQRSYRKKKGIFEYIRHLRTNKPSANTLKLKNRTHSTDSIKVTQLFREFLASVHETAFMNSERLDSRDVHTPMPAIQFTEEDIFRPLRASNPFCSMGPDEIHPRILKESAYKLVSPLSHFFQAVTQLRKPPTLMENGPHNSYLQIRRSTLTH